MKNLRPCSAELTQAACGQADMLQKHPGSEGWVQGFAVGALGGWDSANTAAPLAQSTCHRSWKWRERSALSQSSSSTSTFSAQTATRILGSGNKVSSINSQPLGLKLTRKRWFFKQDNNVKGCHRCKGWRHRCGHQLINFLFCGPHKLGMVLP